MQTRACRRTLRPSSCIRFAVSMIRVSSMLHWSVGVNIFYPWVPMAYVVRIPSYGGRCTVSNAKGTKDWLLLLYPRTSMDSMGNGDFAIHRQRSNSPGN